MTRLTTTSIFLYYDVHTHSKQTTVSEEVMTVYNVAVGKDSLLNMHSGQLVSCGIHPWYIQADTIEEQVKLLRELAANEQVVMIGEAGLDKQVSVSLDLQIEVFEEQIRISEEQKKPLVIHCVKAWDELMVLHKKWTPAMPWLIHGFRKKGEQARQFLKQGFYLSFGEHFQEAALQEAWPDHLLIETDESTCSIQEIYQRIASVLQISVDELGRQIERTICRKFAK